MGFLFASLVEHGHRQSAGVNPQDRGIMCTSESMRSMQRRLHCSGRQLTPAGESVGACVVEPVADAMRMLTDYWISLRSKDSQPGPSCIAIGRFPRLPAAAGPRPRQNDTPLG
jgi:hypothetical protein